MQMEPEFEYKFARFGEALSLADGTVIEGYASLFGRADQGGDIVEAGAYAASLAALAQQGSRVKMLWQHDPKEPIGVWDELREDARGLWVKGRLLTEITRGAEAAALIAAGAIEGLSIGYRTKRSRQGAGGKRILSELDLWEVSVVTFPMLPSARIAAKEVVEDGQEFRAMTTALRQASQNLAQGDFQYIQPGTGQNDA